MMEERTIEEYKLLLDSQSVMKNSEDNLHIKLIKKIREINFSRALLFIYIHYRENGFFTQFDVREHLKLTSASVRNIFLHLTDLKLIKMKYKTGNVTTYTLTLNGERPRLEKYLKYISKTLEGK